MQAFILRRLPMRRISAWIASVALIVFAGAIAYRPLGANSARPDCPGQIQCPLTDEPVCIDQCPVRAAEASPDCCR